MIITISGYPGAGTTTTTKLLAEKLGYEFVNAGKIQREIADEQGLDIVEMNRAEEKDRAFDELVDKKIVEAAKNNYNIILEGRLSGWMMHNNSIESLKIWLDCTFDERVRRISKRDENSTEIVKKETRIRENSEAKRFKEYYDIDISDLSIYDLEVNSNDNLPNEIVGIVLNKINKLQDNG